MPLPNYESLGSFYLGREVDKVTGADQPDLVLYDSRDLTTHAVCVGMTGSGKTGLCLSLLEEAAIDGIPTLAIDPKGDLGNLLLTFPGLQPQDFAPWVDGGEAARKGQSKDVYAAATAETWRKGLQDWGQDGERIQRFKDAAEVEIYTPGSTAGRALSILRSFDAPSAELLSDGAALGERIGSTVAGLLGLLGIDADPVQSREHILLAQLLHDAWSNARNLDLAALIQGIQKPPFDTVGVLDVETFYPAKDRLQLAMRLNHLLAAPGFAAWMKGEPLDIQQLLYTAAGKPRIAIVSIAHLNDAERMFVVTLLLSAVVAWMRRQSGTSSLRALVYMDEIFGYFPPTAMPPSKQPLLTLMKQARAFGIGVVLATQNPVDLDYKGLSNAGTWLIGRLQTERDKARVIDGLLSSSGGGLDRAQLEALLANLSARVFLMRNVHDDAPVLFRSRWALSYLRGPLTLPEIARLQPAQIDARSQPASSGLNSPESGAALPASKPVVPANINEYFLDSLSTNDAMFLPRVLGTVRLHFMDKASGIDSWQTQTYVAPFGHNEAVDWANAEVRTDSVESSAQQAPAHARYASIPSSALRAQSYANWGKDLARHAYEHGGLSVWRCALTRTVSAPGSTEIEFRAQVALALREKRDAAVEALRKKYAPRLTTLEDQVRRAEDRMQRERNQLSEQKMHTALSVGSSILGALLGRKKISATNVGRIGTAARGASRIGRESGDVARAEESLEVLQQRRTDLDNEFAEETRRLQSQFEPAAATIDRVVIKPRKSDIDVKEVALAWVAAR
jgi:hypothetical protein